MMAHRGRSASQPWMCADPHVGPELRLHLEAEYIDAALTFVSLPTSSCDARPDHTFGTGLTLAFLLHRWDERTLIELALLPRSTPCGSSAANHKPVPADWRQDPCL
jgi:hypothetical protein